MERSHPFRSLALAALVLGSLSWAPAKAENRAQAIGDLTILDPNREDRGPDIAARPGGTSLLVWHAERQVPFRLVGQLFAASGQRIGPEIDLGVGVNPQVAALPDGGFALAYKESVELGTHIFLRRLDARGRLHGSAQRVSPDITSPERYEHPRIAVASDGRIAISWQYAAFPPLFTHTAYARFYRADSTPLTDALPIHPNAGSDTAYADVAFDRDGTAIAVWAADFFSPQAALWGRRYGANGSPLTPPIRLSANDDHAHFEPKITPRGAADGSGFWITWERSVDAGGEPFRDPLEARIAELSTRLSSPDVPLSLIPSQGTALGFVSQRVVPAIGTDAAGFVLVVGRHEQEGDLQIAGRLFDPEGQAIGEIFTIDSPDESVLRPAVSSGSGDFLTFWPGGAALTVDQGFQGYDVLGRRLRRLCGSANAACFDVEGRYVFEVEWRQGSSSGTAIALPLTARSATFGLTSDENPDVVLSLVDGANGFQDLLLAATTTAQLTLRITDTSTGASRTIPKARPRFESLRFPGALPIVVPTTAANPLAELSSPDLSGSETRETSLPCSGSRTELCLFAGRFRIALTAPNGEPLANLAALARGDRSGLFALDRGEPALLVRMIDGRAQNGKFWVYRGGLAAIPYRLTITDTQTGAMKIYVQSTARLVSTPDRQAF